MQHNIQKNQQVSAGIMILEITVYFCHTGSCSEATAKRMLPDKCIEIEQSENSERAYTIEPAVLKIYHSVQQKNQQNISNNT
jgi:hypothetical protein